MSNGLPDRYVTSVEASPSQADWVYVTHSGYRDNEFIPRIHRSTDRGQTWTDLSANLPDVAINDVFVLPGHADSVLFVATDAGVYASLNSGQSWGRLGTNMPYIPSFDIDWNPVENTLIAGSFARSIMTYPIDSLLAQPLSAVGKVAQTMKDLKISPNPARAQITITATLANNLAAELTIFDLRGRQVRKAEIPAGGAVSHRFDVATLRAGEYFVRIKSGGKTDSSRFIKQ
ncbi:MAG: T9SS type A sorting domain-containing protein [Saprospiraceae bacterium]|nr:T9SS type A sorting domain-containing protein [Saprospiraceae bacterium]